MIRLLIVKAKYFYIMLKTAGQPPHSGVATTLVLLVLPQHILLLMMPQKNLLLMLPYKLC